MARKGGLARFFESLGCGMDLREQSSGTPRNETIYIRVNNATILLRLERLLDHRSQKWGREIGLPNVVDEDGTTSKDIRSTGDMGLEVALRCGAGSWCVCVCVCVCVCR